MTILLRFEPFEERIIEKLKAKPELFSRIGLSVAEYLKQAPAHDTRLFIWALEEHRDQYVHFHSILDEYFDIMGTYNVFPVIFSDSKYEIIQHSGLCFSDGHCLIIQKTNEIKNVSFMQCGKIII